MELIHCLSQSFVLYAREMFFPILLGFFFSGLFHEFIPSTLIQRYLGEGSFKAIVMATCVGTILPVCCMGSLPIALTMHKKGARMGPVMAFLVATPATSAPALVVSWKMMGGPYTVYMALVVIAMGIVMGLAGNMFQVPVKNSPEICDDCCGSQKTHAAPKLSVRITNVFRYAFIDLPKEIGLELLIGIAVASVIVAFSPIRDFVRTGLEGAKGYWILVAVGLIDYVCSTGSVPVANALVQSGVMPGKSMVYLLMGPITSYGTLLVIRKEFGWNVLAVYLLIISGFSVLSGVLYDVFLR